MIPSQEKPTHVLVENSNEEIEQLVQWTKNLDEIELIS